MKHCDFAGWDSEEQFTLVTVKGSIPLRQKQQPLQESSALEPSEKQVSDTKEVDKENGKVLKETISSPGLRREETEVDIQPGERLSIVVGCQAK